MSITKLIKECANRNYAKASKLFESELEKKVCEILGDEKEDILALDEVEDCDPEEVKAESDEDKKDEPVAESDEEKKDEPVAEDVDTEGDDVEKALQEGEEDEELKTEAEGDEEEVKAEADEHELDYVVEDDFEKIAESVLFGKRK